MNKIMRKIVGLVEKVWFLQHTRTARRDIQKWMLVDKIMWQKEMELTKQRDKKIEEITREFARRRLTAGGAHLAKLWEPRKEFLEELSKAHLEAVRQVCLLSSKNVSLINSKVGHFLNNRFQHQKKDYLRLVLRLSDSSHRDKREKWIDDCFGRVLRDTYLRTDIAAELAKAQTEPPLWKRMLPHTQTEIITLGILVFSILIFRLFGWLTMGAIETLIVGIVVAWVVHILALTRDHYSRLRELHKTKE